MLRGLLSLTLLGLLTTGQSWAERDIPPNSSPTASSNPSIGGTSPALNSQLLLQPNTSKNPKVSALIEAAQQAVHEGHDRLGEHLLLQAIKEARQTEDDPLTLSYAMVALGRLYEITQQPNRALALYHDALDLQKEHQLPSQYNTQEHLANLYAVLGQLQESENLYNTLIHWHQTAVSLLDPPHHNGSTHSNNASPSPLDDESMDHYLALARLHRQLASIYLSFGQNQKAVSAAQDMVSVMDAHFSDDPYYCFPAYLLLGRYYGVDGRYEHGIFWTLKALHVYMNRPPESLGDTYHVHPELLRLVAAQQAQAYQQLSVFYQKTNQLFKAEEARQKAELLQPTPTPSPAPLN